MHALYSPQVDDIELIDASLSEEEALSILLNHLDPSDQSRSTTLAFARPKPEDDLTGLT